MTYVISIGRQTTYTGKIVKEIFLHGQFELVIREGEGQDQDIIYHDLRYVKAGKSVNHVYTNPDSSGTLNSLWKGSYSSGNLTVNVDAKVFSQAHEAPRQSIYPTADQTYPLELYLAPGETKSTVPKSQWTPTPAWIPRWANAAEFETARKKELTDDWFNRLHDIATNFVNNGPSHGLTHRIGRKGTFDPISGAPNPEYCNDLADNIAKQAAAIHTHDALEELFPHKIGLAMSAAQVFLNPATHKLVWHDTQNADWAENTIYEIGDYRNHGSGSSAASYICLQAHTSRSNLVPGTEGGKAHWEKLYISDLPSQVFGENLIRTPINLTTGAGIEELVKVVEDDFTLNGNQLLLKIAKRRRYWRENQMNNFNLTSMNTTTGKGRFNIYEGKKTAQRDRDTVQEAAALRYTQAIWANLSDRYEDALEWVRTT